MIRRVQGNAKGTANLTNSISVVLNTVPTYIDVLCAVVGLFNNTSSVPVVSSIEDNNNNVIWSKVTSSIANNVDCEIWVGVVQYNASTIQTITLTGITYGVCDIVEYSGIAIFDFLDQSITAYGYNSTIATGITSSTTKVNELCIGGIAVGGWLTNISNPINGFTLLDGTPLQIGLSGCVVVGYFEKIVSATGTAGSAASVSYSNYYSGCMITLCSSIICSECGYDGSMMGGWIIYPIPICPVCGYDGSMGWMNQ